MLARLGAFGTGDAAGALVEAWRLDGPMAELVALHGASSPVELQRVLVIPGRRSDTLPDQACRAFDRAHGGDDRGLVESAVLAVTNYRWQKISRLLLERLVEDGVLQKEHIAALSTTLLECDAVPVTVAGSWLVSFYVQQRDDGLRNLDPAKTFTLNRPVAPQVRRWAAAHQAQSRGGIARVVGHARRMDSRHGAAAILGLVDASDDFADVEALELLEWAADWPAPAVRLAALQRLASRGSSSEALARAASDRAGSVRRWAARERQMSLTMPRADASGDDDAGRPEGESAHDTPAPVQQSLWP